MISTALFLPHNSQVFKSSFSNLPLILNLYKQPPEVFFQKRCSWNFAKFTGKHLCQSLFFNKVAGLRPATLLKKKLWHSCFPVNFGKFLKTPFLENTSGRLLLILTKTQFHSFRNWAWFSVFEDGFYSLCCLSCDKVVRILKTEIEFFKISFWFRSFSEVWIRRNLFWKK